MSITVTKNTNAATKILPWDARVRVFRWLQWQSPATLGLNATGLTPQDAKYGWQRKDD